MLLNVTTPNSCRTRHGATGLGVEGMSPNHQVAIRRGARRGLGRLMARWFAQLPLFDQRPPLVGYLLAVVGADVALIGWEIARTPLRTGNFALFVSLLACSAVCIEATRRLGDARRGLAGSAFRMVAAYRPLASAALRTAGTVADQLPASAESQAHASFPPRLQRRRPWSRWRRGVWLPSSGSVLGSRGTPHSGDPDVWLTYPGHGRRRPSPARCCSPS